MASVRVIDPDLTELLVVMLIVVGASVAGLVKLRARIRLSDVIGGILAAICAFAYLAATAYLFAAARPAPMPLYNYMCISCAAGAWYLIAKAKPEWKVWKAFFLPSLALLTLHLVLLLVVRASVRGL